MLLGAFWLPKAVHNSMSFFGRFFWARARSVGTSARLWREVDAGISSADPPRAAPFRARRDLINSYNTDVRSQTRDPTRLGPLARRIYGIKLIWIFHPEIDLWPVPTSSFGSGIIFGISSKI